MCERLPFLKEKAENFRAFLLQQSPDAELTAQIEGFKPDLLLPTLTGVLLPTIAIKGIPGIVSEMMAHLTPADPDAVKDKLTRYLHCFQDVLLE